MNMPNLRGQTRKEKKNHLSSSLQAKKMISFLSLLLILFALPVTIFLVNHQQIFTTHASSTDSLQAEAESASLSGPVTTGYDANASGTSTTANYIQFGTGTILPPTPTPTVSNYGNIYWRGDFETGDLSQWAGVHFGSAWDSDSSINVDTSPVRQGNYAAQFTVNTNPYGNPSDRAELSATQANTGGYAGQDWYYSWSTYLPSHPNLTTGWADWTNLMQWMDLYHQCSPPAVVLIMPGYRNNPPSKNPFFALVDQPMDNQNGCATLAPKHQFYLGDVVYDQWVDFTVHIKWSVDPTIGYVELWMNGKQLIAKQYMRTLDTSGGVYQEAQLYRGDNWSGTNVVYHDNVIRHDAYTPGTTGSVLPTGNHSTRTFIARAGQHQTVLTATDPITDSSLSAPSGIGVVSSQSQVWVSNRGKNTISVFDYNGNLVKVISGNGLSAPYEPTVVGNQVWVPNSGNSTISVFNQDGTPAGVGPFSGNSLSKPKGMTVVGNQIWVSNDGNSTISRFKFDGTSAGAALTSVANPRGGGVITVNGVQQAWIPSHGGSIYRLDLNGNQVAAPITGNSLDNVESIGLVGSQIWAPDASGQVSTFNPDGSVASGSPITDSTFGDIHGVAQIGSQIWIPDTSSNAISVVAIPASTAPTPTPTTAATPTPTGTSTAMPTPTDACTTTLPSGTGVATASITIPSTGTYNLWTRMMVPSASANSYYLQVDSGCPYLFSDSVATNSWDWVTSAPTLSLSSGSHTITMIGDQAGVKVDELIFSQSCTPTGKGDNCFASPTPTPTPQQQAGYPSAIKNVFVIVMENTDWSQIKGNTTSAPYINSLLPRSDASYASNYHNVAPSETANGYLHPSEPNYIWLEGGTNSFPNHTFTTDNDATSGNYTTSTNHLTTLLQNKGLSWKAYEESMPSGCPTTSSGNYAAKHNPFVFFTDVSGNPPSSTNTNCSSHVVPFSQLATDVQNNSLSSYSFITPNLCDDMHDNSCPGSNDPIHQGDTWLSNNLPTILNSQAYKNGGAVFITWDEGSGSTTNNPIGMIVLSPLAKGNGYTNTTLYSHSSFVRTVETIFGLSPLLANASSATDLSDLFVTSGGLTPTPTLSPSPTPTDAPPPAFWAQDTFQRPNQTYWGVASNGMTWGSNANRSSSFSISKNTGLIKPSSAADLNAVLGSSIANAEVLMSGSMTALAGGNSLGVVLRWSNKSNFYRAVLTGSKLVIQRVVNGSVTTLKSTPFPASPNTSYTMLFTANDTTLSAEAWRTGSIEPAKWMVTATDSTFSSGQCGIRTHQQRGTTATITSFEVTQL
jgi:phosphatidylinositol-3-phosphatase